MESKPDTFLRQPPQKCQAFLAILDGHPGQPDLIDDQFFQLILLLLRQFSRSPPGRTVRAIVLRVTPVSYDGVNGPYSSLLAISFSASLAYVLSAGPSFSLTNNPAPLEGTETSERFDHAQLKDVWKETHNGLKTKRLEVWVTRSVL